MKRIFFMMTAVIIFAACKQNKPADATDTATAVTEEKTESSEPKGQFEMKSGILVMETVMPGMGTTTTKITFDDHGKQKLTETTMAMSMAGHTINNTSKSLIKDDYAYTWSAGSKQGTKFKMDMSGINKKDIDFSKLTDEMKKKMNLKEEGSESIDGKDCKVFTYEMDQGMKGKIWLWKQMPIQMEMNMGGKTIFSKYKSFEEDPSIPAGTFDVPSDVQFNEMSMPTAHK